MIVNLGASAPASPFILSVLFTFLRLVRCPREIRDIGSLIRAAIGVFVSFGTLGFRQGGSVSIWEALGCGRIVCAFGPDILARCTGRCCVHELVERGGK
jgi:hypothetical protein